MLIAPIRRCTLSSPTHVGVPVVLPGDGRPLLRWTSSCDVADLTRRRRCWAVAELDAEPGSARHQQQTGHDAGRQQQDERATTA